MQILGLHITPTNENFWDDGSFDKKTNKNARKRMNFKRNR